MDFGYDIPSIARDLDWIAVMTYDYHGHWDKKTGHVSPMYNHPDDDYDYFNTVSLNLHFYFHLSIHPFVCLFVGLSETFLAPKAYTQAKKYWNDLPFSSIKWPFSKGCSGR